jgi:hypothetical protein
MRAFFMVSPAGLLGLRVVAELEHVDGTALNFTVPTSLPTTLTPSRLAASNTYSFCSIEPR